MQQSTVTRSARQRKHASGVPRIDLSVRLIKLIGLPSGSNFVLDRTNDRREYGTASATGDQL